MSIILETEFVSPETLHSDLLTTYRGEERREKPRIRIPFPVTVKGTDSDGRSFEVDTVLDDLSANGLHLSLAKHEVKRDTKVWATIQMALGLVTGTPVPRVVIRGLVERVEQTVGGSRGVAVRITHHKLL